MIAPTSLDDLMALAMILQAIREHIKKTFPALHVSLFVSEAGLRRGLAISREPIPSTFVLLATDDNSMEPEQEEMTKDSFMLYLGLQSRTEIAIDYQTPKSLPEDAWDEVLQSLESTFHVKFTKPS